MLKASGDFVGAALARRPALNEARRQQLVGLRLLDGPALRGGAALLRQRGANRAEGHVTAATLSSEIEGWIGLGLLENGRARHGEILIAASPVYGEEARVRIVSPYHVDPENHRVRG